MRYEDLSVEQTKALLDAIRELIRNPPEGELDDAALLALLPGRVTEADTDPAPGPAPGPDPDPAPETTPQGVFQFSVPVSGWGAEAYRIHWGDESVEIAQSRGNRASLADIETALESLHGIRDVEVTAPGLADIIEGTGGRPYRVAIIDADPDTFRVTKGNGKNASVRIVDDGDEPAPVDPGPGGADPGPGASTGPTKWGFDFVTEGPAYGYDAVKLRVKPYPEPATGWDNLPWTGYILMNDLAGLPSRVEAALVSLPSVVSVEDVTIAPYAENDRRLTWRIELTVNGASDPSILDFTAFVKNTGPYPAEFDNEYNHAAGAGNGAWGRPLGAGRFQFDAVTSGALTPGLSEMDGADDAGADPVASVPAVDAWPLAVHLADPGGLDLLI